MDSGAAVTAAQIGRECGVRRTSTVSRSVVSIVVDKCCLASGAQHNVNMRAYHCRTDDALVNRVSTQHLDTARKLLNLFDEALAKTQHVWPNMRDGKELPAPHADASLPLRPGRGLKNTRTLGSACILRRSSSLRVDEGLIENPSCQRTSVPRARLRRSLIFVV